MDLILMILKIAGSLGLFLYGMKLLSDGLQKCAGSKMKSILHLMTGNRLMAVLTGIIVTMIIQSSSAATVMVVSFVNASLMNLTQAIGVILGANIGTTVTGWIVALLGFKMDITVLSLVAVAVALPLMFSDKSRLIEVSEIFLGFGILFLGLEFLQDSMPDISRNPEILSFLSRFEDGSVLSMLLCVLIGTILTIIVQSSSATMAITITMAYQGWIGLYTACALCLGQNIGTTVTAYLASVGASTSARRAALAHILFNCIGSVIAMILFKPMIIVVNAITPGDIFTMSGDALRETLPAFLAMFHTLFNSVNTLIFFPFIGKYAQLITKLVRDKKAYNKDDYHFSYISGPIMETPELYLVTVKGEITKMASLAEEMYVSYTNAFARNNIDIKQIVSEMKKSEDYADQMQEQLMEVCVKIQKESPNASNASQVSTFLRVIDELESVTDSIFNLIKLTEQKIKQHLTYTPDEELEMKSLVDMVGQFLSFISARTDRGLTRDDLEKANAYERSINQQHRVLSERVHKRLGEGSSDIQTELIMLEVERNLEHIGDYLINIAEAFQNDKRHTPVLERVAPTTT